MTLKDVANQLLLPILSDVDPSGMELSPEEEVVKAELKKGMSGNAKLSHWVRLSPMQSCHIGSHPHYAIKPLYFLLAIKIFARVSLPLAPMFLGHLYV